MSCGRQRRRDARSAAARGRGVAGVRLSGAPGVGLSRGWAVEHARGMRKCCQSKPTGEQRRATRRAGRLLGRWQALLPRRRPAIPSRARRMCESRACHLTYTRSGGCRRAPNSFLRKKTHVNVSSSRGRLPGTNLASALKSRSSPGVRWYLIVSRYR